MYIMLKAHIVYHYALHHNKMHDSCVKYIYLRMIWCGKPLRYPKECGQFIIQRIVEFFSLVRKHHLWNPHLHEHLIDICNVPT